MWLQNWFCRKWVRRRIKELEAENLRLQKEVNFSYSKPDFIDFSKEPYQPKLHAAGQDVVLNASDIYTKNKVLTTLAKDMEKSSKKKTLNAIWQFVTEQFSYRHDEGEEWRHPSTTLQFGFGDCEDTTILFVTLARAAGIHPHTVFNACGLVHKQGEKFGHSFPIVYDDFSLNEGWMIYESTLNKPGKPMKLDESNYTIDWGVANDCFAGALKTARETRRDMFQKSKRTRDEELRKLQLIR